MPNPTPVRNDRSQRRVAGMAALLAAAVALTGSAAPGSADSAAPAETTPVDNSPEPTQQFDNTEGLAITLTVDGVEVPVTMVDNAAAQEFASILLITVTMRDLMGREAYGAGLPVDLTDEAPRRTDYEVGEFVYWPRATASPCTTRSRATRCPSRV